MNFNSALQYPLWYTRKTILTGTFDQKSAEYFVAAGYAVIFLYREFSLTPFARHWSHSKEGFLDYLTEGPNGTVMVGSQHQEKILSVLRTYNEARRNNMLLLLPFTTIIDYLHELYDLRFPR